MYGKSPYPIGVFPNAGDEMMFYQDHPIKLSGQSAVKLEERLLNSFEKIISTACCDFVGNFGLWLTVIVGASIGWVWNIVKLVQILDLSVTGMLVARAIGVFVAPLGAVLGYL